MEADNQLRVLYLYQLLLRHTDAEHPISTKELIDMMENCYQIKLHRTTIPKYIDILNAAGLEVIEIRSREKRYYLNDRLFELPEVKLLIDAVQSSKFISANKSQELISKLMTLTSEANAAKLQHNLYITGRVCFLQALFPQKCRLTSSKLHGEFPQYCISPSGTLLGAGEEPLQAYKVY